MGIMGTVDPHEDHERELIRRAQAGEATAFQRLAEEHAAALWRSALALGNSFPLIPCRLADAGCTAHHQLYSPGGLTDAVVAGTAFLVLAFTPAPLWRRMRLLPPWRRLEPVLAAARVVCPLCFIVLSISSITGVAEGLTERILATACVLWIGALAVTAISISRQPATRPSAGAAGRTRPSRSRPARSAARRRPRT